MNHTRREWLQRLKVSNTVGLKRNGIKWSLAKYYLIALIFIWSTCYADFTTSKLSWLKNRINQVSINGVNPSSIPTLRVWLNDMSHRLSYIIPDPVTRLTYLVIIYNESLKSKIDPELVLSIIMVESHFNPYAVSSKGAIGLMQVMPFWVHLIGNPQNDLFDVATNIHYGCIILEYYLQINHHNLLQALSQYNGSSGLNSSYDNLVLSVYKNRFAPYPVLSLDHGNTVVTNYTSFK